MCARILISLTWVILALGALPAWSGSKSELVEVFVLEGTQRLGDPPGQPSVEFLVPVEREVLEKAVDAALEFKSANVCCGSSLKFNGRGYLIPWSEDRDLSSVTTYERTTIPIPVGALEENNVLVFEAGFFGGTRPYDDYTIADVYLVLSLVGSEGDGDGLRVAIDFKTNDKRNVINPHSKGRVWVAVLSDSEFDAQQVDPMTVALGAGGAVPDKYVSKYSNRDGMLDLVLRFKTPEIGLQCGDTDVTLTGETYAGEDIIGTDRLVTVGCK
jgi:hypothetical protein